MAVYTQVSAEALTDFLARYDHGECPMLAMDALERENFLVHPVRTCCPGTAQDDLKARLPQCRAQFQS